MKKQTLLWQLSALLLICSTAYSQDSKKNALYLELGGNAIAYSVNYDHLVTLSEQVKLAPRVGFGYFPKNKTSTYTGVMVPLEANVLWAKAKQSKNFLEAGLGLSLIGMRIGDRNLEPEPREQHMARVALIRLGLRHQKPAGGFMYRAGLLVPVAQDEKSHDMVGDDIFLRLYAGFSLGYSF